MTKKAAQLDAEIAEALRTRSPKTRGSRAKIVKDVFARSSDAEFILEDDEGDLPWTEEQRPLNWFKVGGGKSLEHWAQTLDQHDQDRLEAIKTWARTRGGLGKAVREKPILAFENGTVLDGAHRLLVALQQGLRTVTVLVGHRP